MSFWSDITTLGSGTVDYRLMIEGWPHEWVTNARITHATNKAERTVYPGLQYSGLRFSERIVLRDAWPQCSGMTVTINPSDVDEDTLSGFTRDSQKVGLLVADLDDDDTTWTTKPADLAPGIYHVASEAILCDGDNNITRGYWDTLGQYHTTQVANRSNPVPIYSWPPTMEGRRAYLYAYGTSDDPDGDGNIIWRGVVARPPRMSSDGISWTIELQPITSVFDQNIGSDDTIEYKVRGIYHTNQCPMWISVGVGYKGIPGSNGWTLSISGFFETQTEWVAHVNDQLIAMLAANPITDIAVIQYGVGYYDGPKPYIVIAETGESVVHVLIKDVLDGDLPITAQGNSRSFQAADNHIDQAGANGEFVVQGTSFQPPWSYPLPNARCMVGMPIFDALSVNGPFGEKPFTDLTEPFGGYGDPDGAWPSNRIYLQSVDKLSVGEVLMVKESADAEKPPQLLEITLIDTTNLYIEVAFSNAEPIYISDEMSLVKVPTYTSDNDISGFVQDIVNKSPQANLGVTPYITANDVNATNWNDLYFNNPVPVYWRHRSYQFVSPTKVADVVKPELQVAGWMAHLAADGRVDLAKMPFVSSLRTAQHTITDSDILYPAEGLCGDWPTWEAQKDGLVNIIHLRLGYSPFMDDFDERFDFIIRNTASIAEHKSGQKAKQEIGPKSLPTSGGTEQQRLKNVPPAQELADMVWPYLQTLSADYSSVTISVPFTKFNVLCGDIVTITCRELPNGSGGRGVTNRNAICVGREWDLDPKSNRMGKLTFWFARNFGSVSGYAPTGRIGNKVNTTGNVWVLTFDPANTRNIAWSEGNDGDVVKHFALGDIVEVLRVDVTSETRVLGEITDVPGASQIEVTFASTWTPGANLWNMRFATGESTPATEREFLYTWVADSDGQIGGSDTAWSFQ